jgi:hypothetical protein
VFLVASLLLCLCNVWAAVAKSFESLLAARLVASFAGASTEALGAAIVNVSHLGLFFLLFRMLTQNARTFSSFMNVEARWVSILFSWPGAILLDLCVEVS